MKAPSWKIGRPFFQSRRSLLKTIPIAPLALPAGLAAEIRRTVIESIELHTIKVNARGNWLLVRLRTSNGLTGLGDASHGGADNLKPVLLNQFFAHVKGRSVCDIEWLRSKSEHAIL